MYVFQTIKNIFFIVWQRCKYYVVRWPLHKENNARCIENVKSWLCFQRSSGSPQRAKRLLASGSGSSIAEGEILFNHKHGAKCRQPFIIARPLARYYWNTNETAVKSQVIQLFLFSGVCENFHFRGENCYPLEKLNGHCGCAKGMTCKWVSATTVQPPRTTPLSKTRRKLQYHPGPGSYQCVWI